MFVWNRLPRPQALVSGKENILRTRYIFFYQKQVPVALGIFFYQKQVPVIKANSFESLG